VNKATRNSIQRATQAARQLLQQSFRETLEGTYDILLDGSIAGSPGTHLSPQQRVIREKMVAAISHKRSSGLKPKEAVDGYLREAAFTTLNRFVALKMLEARKLVQECVSKGEDSTGFKEFTALAPGLVAVPDKGYRQYIETLFDEIGQEVRVLFDRRDVASLLWPSRQTLLELLDILNASELASVWAEDETIGWVYQYFNGDEERTQMRKESQAPRDSRELAVRNQFFTPRYVVQFLTDNTLGRAWYEMMQGDTKLAHLDYLVRRPNEVLLADGESAPASDADDSELSQDALLQQTVHVPFRDKKDPRDLRILDPACGSGHFLLYTFDLLITIYEEAWADTGAAAFTETATPLRADYESLEDLRRAMPELILRHNLHGVDIDPRAAQIAALALWMRAQRAYNQFEVDRAQRPSITKTNIVVAEPMPGDVELVDEFAASLKPAVLGDLFKKMVEEMKLAGELGSLLKIEESISKAVKEASEANQQGNLFGGKDANQEFWDTADEKIVKALFELSESAAGAGGVRRQLFAGDAAQGVVFIELMRKRFDVALANPPFGEATDSSGPYMNRHYSDGRNDVYGAFVLRALELTTDINGAIGFITSRAFVAGRDMRHFRPRLLDDAVSLRCFVDLGLGVLDNATVETAAYTAGPNPKGQAQFLDLRNAPRREATLAGAQDWIVVPLQDLRTLPGAQFLYDLDQQDKRKLLDEGSLEPDLGRVTKGLSTGDDERFVRAWWEVEPTQVGPRWKLLAKGGEYSWLTSTVHLLVNRSREGEEMAALAEQGDGNAARTRQSSRYYGLAATTWSRRSQKGFSARRLRAGVCFSDKSPVVVPTEEYQWALEALPIALASESYIRLIDSQAKFGSFETGAVKRLPLPPSQLGDHSDSISNVYRLVDSIDARDETSLLFSGLPSREFNPRLVAIEALSIVDRILAACGMVLDAEVAQKATDALASRGFRSPWVQSLVSWAVGVGFGRFDASKRMGSLGAECDGPFAPLPICPSAMLLHENGLPPSATPEAYMEGRGVDGVLVDDPGHASDIIDHVLRVLSDCEPDVETVLMALGGGGARADSLRGWVAKKYFAWHLKAYSKRPRKAPIYWQLSTPSASYSVWCYYHRLSRDTFFRVANDYVTLKVDHEERKLNALRQEAGPDPSSKQRKEIDAQETFVAELRAFLTEVKRIAPLWNPNLNDGVIINFAPLWRLVPQHKAWHKECKKVWDKLVKGDYDWAHLAMHLWPERVVPKCMDDRSLAIAHGLQDDLWYEDDEGKKTVWKKRQVSADRLSELVAERSSKAVKAALEDLLSAPAPMSNRKGRSRRARATGGNR